MLDSLPSILSEYFCLDQILGFFFKLSLSHAEFQLAWDGYMRDYEIQAQESIDKLKVTGGEDITSLYAFIYRDRCLNLNTLHMSIERDIFNIYFDTIPGKTQARGRGTEGLVETRTDV